MKAIGAGLQAHLDTGVTTIALCWTVTRTDGVVQGFTEHDLDLEFGGLTYRSDSGFGASEIEQSLGLAVDTMSAVGALSSLAINEDDLARGAYDGALIEVLAVNWQDPAERVVLMAGSIGRVTRGRTAFEAEVRSLSHALGQATGRTYQYFCDAVLGDARCAVDLDDPAYRATGTVSAADGLSLTLTGLGAFADGWFSGGRLVWTGGANDGLAFEVRKHLGAVVTLWSAPPDPVAQGDPFTLTAGCDKAAKTCQAKFSNILNFRGFPHMPGNDVVQSYPNRGERRLDGSSLLR